MDSVERHGQRGGGRDSRPARVIVGVDGSLGSLGALRQAVAEARQRGAELCAARVVREDHPWIGLVPLGEEDMETLRGQTETAFQDALGGVPADLRVRCVLLTGEPGPALVDFACREEDLLVVGASWQAGLRRWWHRPVSGYCVRHAHCPVLTVPLSELARTLVRTRRSRWEADLDQLLDA
jgi:nucleotide-binding universal stress UspA family protein